MNTHHTHHTPSHAPNKEVALRWLARQLRWERLLDELRNPRAAADEDKAA